MTDLYLRVRVDINMRGLQKAHGNKLKDPEIHVQFFHNLYFS